MPQKYKLNKRLTPLRCNLNKIGECSVALEILYSNDSALYLDFGEPASDLLHHGIALNIEIWISCLLQVHGLDSPSYRVIVFRSLEIGWWKFLSLSKFQIASYS